LQVHLNGIHIGLCRFDLLFASFQISHRMLNRLLRNCVLTTEFLVPFGILLEFHQVGFRYSQLCDGLFISTTVLLLIDRIKLLSFLYFLSLCEINAGDIAGYERTNIYLIYRGNSCRVRDVKCCRTGRNRIGVY